jgi:hypothetical protein
MPPAYDFYICGISEKWEFLKDYQLLLIMLKVKRIQLQFLVHTHLFRSWLFSEQPETFLQPVSLVICV